MPSAQRQPVTAGVFANDGSVENLWYALVLLVAALCSGDHFVAETDEESGWRRNLIARLAAAGEIESSLRGALAVQSGEVTVGLDAFIRELSDIAPVALQSLLAVLVSENGVYDGRGRVLMFELAATLNVTRNDVRRIELLYIKALPGFGIDETAAAEVEAENDEKKKDAAIKSKLMVGMAAVAGGVLIGITGGIAAPFVAAGAGVAFGTGTAAALATTTGMVLTATLFGAGGAGLVGYVRRAS